MTKKQILWMIILAGVVFTNILESMILMPLASTIKADLDMDDNQWGIAISVYLFAAFVAGILSIFFIDKFDRKRFLVALYSLFIVGTYFCGIANNYAFFVFARIFAGFFGGVITATVLAMVGDLVDNAHRGKATAIVMVGFATAAALGIPLGIIIGLDYSWHIPFFAIVAFSVIVLICIVLFFPQINAHLQLQEGRKTYHIFKSIVKNNDQLKALLFTCTISFGQFAIIPYLADFAENNVGFSKQDLKYIYLFGGISTFLTVPIIGYLADKFGRIQVFLITMLISCIPILWLTNMGPTAKWIVLIATSLFFIFSMGRGIPGTAIVISTAAPYERGGFMSVQSALQQLSSGIAVLLGSFIVVQNESTLVYYNFEWVGYIGVATSILSYFILKTIKQKY
jgi:predicted MFS family arabinose efflux permease